MNKAKRPAILNTLNNLKISFFHSTPVLDRKRRTHWNFVCLLSLSLLSVYNQEDVGGSSKDSSKKYNQYVKKNRKLHSKLELLRNVGAFAEQLFQSWKDGSADKDSKDRLWFEREFVGNRSKGPHSARRRGFDFCDGDDSDVETIFSGSFGGARFFYSSFFDKDFPGSTDNSQKYNKWRRLDEEEYYDTSSEPNIYESERMALGLCASGPLNIEDVKNAYRVCALKWHPDRHQGKTKAVAEEKFKACNAAYQSLCDKLCPA